MAVTVELKYDINSGCLCHQMSMVRILSSHVIRKILLDWKDDPLKLKDKAEQAMIQIVPAPRYHCQALFTG